MTYNNYAWLKNNKLLILVFLILEDDILEDDKIAPYYVKRFECLEKR